MQSKKHPRIGGVFVLEGLLRNRVRFDFFENAADDGLIAPGYRSGIGDHNGFGALSRHDDDVAFGCGKERGADGVFTGENDPESVAFLAFDTGRNFLDDAERIFGVIIVLR